MDGYVATLCPGNQIKTLAKHNWAGEVAFLAIFIFDFLAKFFIILKTKQVQFDNLEGGRQQYTLTVSVLVKNAKLKVVTPKNLS